MPTRIGHYSHAKQKQEQLNLGARRRPFPDRIVGAHLRATCARAAPLAARLVKASLGGLAPHSPASGHISMQHARAAPQRRTISPGFYKVSTLESDSDNIAAEVRQTAQSVKWLEEQTGTVAAPQTIEIAAVMKTQTKRHPKPRTGFKGAIAPCSGDAAAVWRDHPEPGRAEAPAPAGSVGRAGPSRDGRQRRQPGGSVGRAAPTRNLRRRAARGSRSVGAYRVGNATYGYS